MIHCANCEKHITSFDPMYQPSDLCRACGRKLEALIEAVRAWDRLFVWAEPFEGYDEEKALHRALLALSEGEDG